MGTMSGRQYFDVTIRPGRVVRAFVNHVESCFPFDSYPPHTRMSKCLATIDWGENYHGDLTEDYYLIRNDPTDPAYWTLWVGTSGSQVDDDSPRLWAAAWCDFIGPDWCEDEKRETRKIGEVLLYAWIRAFHQGSRDRLDPSMIEGSSVLAESRIMTIAHRALARQDYPQVPELSEPSPDSTPTHTPYQPLNPGVAAHAANLIAKAMEAHAAKRKRDRDAKKKPPSNP